MLTIVGEGYGNVHEKEEKSVTAGLLKVLHAFEPRSLLGDGELYQLLRDSCNVALVTCESGATSGTGMFPGSETLRQSGITATSSADTAVALRVPNSGYIRAVKGGLEGPASLRAVLTLLIPLAGCSQCPPMF